MFNIKKSILRFAGVSVVAVASALSATHAVAQTDKWPERAVKIIVPAPPGSAPDSLVRMFAQKFSAMWGQTVTVENIVGASGNIGTDRAAKAPADGYTLLFNTMGPISVNYTLFQGKLPYDPVKDLAPISLIAKMPNFLTVHPKLPVNTVAELIAMAKKEPGKLRYGTAGPGTTQHLSGELLNLRENIKLKLLNARLGLLARQYDAARSDMAQVIAAVRRYADGQSRKTQQMLALLEQAQQQTKAGEVPRLDASLAALATAAAGR